MKNLLRSAIRRILPKGVRAWVRRRTQRSSFVSFYDAMSRTGADSPNPWIRKSSEIGGCLFPEEPEFLWELASRPITGHVLEIGTWMGKSACILAGACKEHAPGSRVICVDTFRMTGTPEQEEQHKFVAGNGTFYEFVSNASRFGFEDLVVPIATLSSHAIPALRGPFRMVFVDGTHDRIACSRDVELCLPLIAPGGVLALHDSAGSGWPEITAYVQDELNNFPTLRRIGQRATITAFEKLPSP
jgi:predicted O-methyltransferase YrrM